MTNPISCPCSHRLECHGVAGCAGDEKSACACRLDSDEALYTAIDAERAAAFVATATGEQIGR